MKTEGQHCKRILLFDRHYGIVRVSSRLCFFLIGLQVLKTWAKETFIHVKYEGFKL